MRECCQAMQQQKEKLMAEMKAQDAELAAQVTAMNNAPDDKKLGLIASVVSHIVDQRIAMTARMEKMHEQMMGHMMQHMSMGKESMSDCPMMKGMDDKSSASPEAHHDQQK